MTEQMVAQTEQPLHARQKARHVLFLSHAGVDTEAARQLVDLIEATPEAREQGLKVWFDKRDLEAGSGWQQQLERAIEERSTAFAVYLGATGVINWSTARCAWLSLGRGKSPTIASSRSSARALTAAAPCRVRPAVPRRARRRERA
jgi:TIR domain